MSISDQPMHQSADESSRKPCLAIMGEFSSGKSTLSNLLIGSNPLPVKVTATQLPPVWMSYGDQTPFREDIHGEVYPVDIDHLDDIPLQETAVIRIFLQAEILEMCDIIDMPGISDPNMPPEVWERMVHHADAVLWCTHATQAWRQSEAAVWQSLPSDLRTKSMLLITRIDKILNDRDRQKILKRVARETDGLFAKTFPISLTQALVAKDDAEQWEKCGADAFSQSLIQLLENLAGTITGHSRRLLNQITEAFEPDPVPDVLHSVSELPEPALDPAPIVDAIPGPARIVPSRIRVAATTDSNRSRPNRPLASSGP